MRSSSLIHWAIYSAPLLATLAVIWFAFPTEFDTALYFREHRAAHPYLNAFMQFITDWSNPFFYGFFGLMLLNAYKSADRERLRFVLILLAVQVVVSVLAVHFVKSTIGRPRPGQGAWFDPLTSRGAQHSLPSGHTTEIIGWTLPLALRHKALWLTLFFSLFIGLVGFSRIYLGWHHPSDVFFGWMLGSLGGFATTIIAATSLFAKEG